MKSSCCFALISLLFSCSPDDCPVIKDPFEEVEIIASYAVSDQNTKHGADNIVITTNNDFEQILVGEFGYSGSYRFTEGAEIVIGSWIYINHYGFKPVDINLSYDKQEKVLLLELFAKENYDLVNENEGYVWKWVKIKSREISKLKVIRSYEIFN